MISALGVYLHQLWMMWLGSGIIGGCGLGLGYISPVSTLIKWFPDRRGMATGMAIMGFGGGAMIGSPLATMLMNHYATPTSVGVWETFVTMGLIYFVFMLGGAFGYRLPAAGWKPEGWTPPTNANAMITTGNVHLKDAHKTVQFWLIWAVLCLNVSAGIGIIGAASPMLQETFGGRLFGDPCVGFGQFSDEQKANAALVGAAFVGLFSLFNIAGRFFWASLSDKLGRKIDLFHLLHARLPLLCGGADARHARHARRVRRRLLPHRLDVWRRLRHHSCLSRRHFRHAVRRRHSRAPAHRLVDGGHRRAGDRQLHARRAQSRRNSARPDLPPDLLCSCRAPGRRLHRQPTHQAVATRNGS